MCFLLGSACNVLFGSGVKVKENQKDTPGKDYPNSFPKGFPSSIKAKSQKIRGQLTPYPITIVEVTQGLLVALSIDEVELVSLAKDLEVVNRIVSELGIEGQVYVKNIKETPHLIIKGYAGKRAVLNAPNYGLTNPKISHIAVTPKQLLRSGLRGTIFQFVLYAAWNAADELFSQKDPDLARFLGNTISGALKAAASAGIAVLVASATVTPIGVAVVAAGPLLVAAAVSIAAGLVLDKIDEEFGLTDKLIAYIANEVKAIQTQSKDVQRQWLRWERWLERDPNAAMRALFGG